MRPLLEAVVGDLGPILVMAFAATGAVLVLAMVNVGEPAGRAQHGAAARDRRRAALGATRADLLRPLLAEASVIAAAAAAAGLLLAQLSIRAIVVLGGSALPRVEAMHARSTCRWLFTSVVMLIAVLAVALVPGIVDRRLQPRRSWRMRAAVVRQHGPADTARCSASWSSRK